VLFVLEFFTLIASVFSLTYALLNEACYNDYICFRNFMFGCFVCSVLLFILVLNHKQWFQKFVDMIQSCKVCCNIKLPVFIVSLFLSLGFIDFFLLSISAACESGNDDCDEPLLDPHAGNGEVRHITRTLTAVCAILFVLTVFAHWDHFSYICAHYAWVHAIFYCSIVGGLFLEIARWLVPPTVTGNKVWSWHTRHNFSEILDWIMLIILVLVTMFVWLSAIIVAFFTEIANESQEWGAYWATLIYCILALILGVSPLAPGSVSDAVGGYLLVKIYMHDSQGYNFSESIIIALAFVTVLHFVGSCLQYWIGKLKTVQAWANFSMPPDILAASDSVLLEANCITVGLVGQVFMDTFSGLNQGRMGMDFCTQFWSEYASLPTGYSWVAVGAVLSVQGAEGYEWATDAIPICLLMAATWQFVGSTFGGYKMLNANGDELFWKNKEKWETVQHFSREGVKVTREGWIKDCFCLNVTDEGIEKSLFDRIRPVHEDYMSKISSPNQSVKENKITQKIYNHDRSKLRKEHWEKLKSFYFEEKVPDDTKVQIRKEFEDYFLRYEPICDRTNQNAWRQGKLIGIFTLQHFLVSAAITLGMFSYLFIGKDIETEVAVQNGMKVLTDVGSFELSVFAGYNIIVLVYYHHSFVNSLKSGWNSILSVVFCKWCKTSQDQTMETTFRMRLDRKVFEKHVFDI